MDKEEFIEICSTASIRRMVEVRVKSPALLRTSSQTPAALHANSVAATHP